MYLMHLSCWFIGSFLLFFISSVVRSTIGKPSKASFNLFAWLFFSAFMAIFSSQIHKYLVK